MIDSEITIGPDGSSDVDITGSIASCIKVGLDVKGIKD